MADFGGPSFVGETPRKSSPIFGGLGWIFGQISVHFSLLEGQFLVKLETFGVHFGVCSTLHTFFGHLFGLTPLFGHF